MLLNDAGACSNKTTTTTKTQKKPPMAHHEAQVVHPSQDIMKVYNYATASAFLMLAYKHDKQYVIYLMTYTYSYIL